MYPQKILLLTFLFCFYEKEKIKKGNMVVFIYTPDSLEEKKSMCLLYQRDEVIVFRVEGMELVV